MEILVALTLMAGAAFLLKPVTVDTSLASTVEILERRVRRDRRKTPRTTADRRST